MSRKSRERYKDKIEGDKGPKPQAESTSEMIRRRRNKRFLFVALIGLAFPVLELVAYQFRVITFTLVNRSEKVLQKIKVTYTGGEFDAPELKPGASLTRPIRPDFTFKGNNFSTYAQTVRFSVEGGEIFSQIGRSGALDFSAQEIYTVTLAPPTGRVQVQHTTRLGFPLSLVRDLMERLGFR